MAAIQKAITIIGEVNNTINSSSGDWGTLCKWTNINKWSRCKPFRYPAVAFADDEAYEAARYAANYGLKLPEGVASIPEILAHEVEYLKPEGNVNVSPFRILDFDGYVHDKTTAGPPITPLGDISWDTNNSQTLTKALTWILKPSTASQIALKEFYELRDYFPCLVILRNGVYWMKTLSSTIGALSDQASSIAFSLSYVGSPFGAHDSYQYYLVAYENRVDSWTRGLLGEYRGLPFDVMAQCGGTLRIYDSWIKVRCSAIGDHWVSNTNWKIRVQLSVPQGAQSGEQNIIELWSIGVGTGVNPTIYNLAQDKRKVVTLNGSTPSTVEVSSTDFATPPSIDVDGFIKFVVSCVQLWIGGSGYVTPKSFESTQYAMSTNPY